MLLAITGFTLAVAAYVKEEQGVLFFALGFAAGWLTSVLWHWCRRHVNRRTAP